MLIIDWNRKKNRCYSKISLSPHLTLTLNHIKLNSNPTKPKPIGSQHCTLRQISVQMARKREKYSKSCKSYERHGLKGCCHHITSCWCANLFLVSKMLSCWGFLLCCNTRLIDTLQRYAKLNYQFCQQMSHSLLPSCSSLSAMWRSIWSFEISQYWSQYWFW